jgi:hypothetical protein
MKTFEHFLFILDRDVSAYAFLKSIYVLLHGTADVYRTLIKRVSTPIKVSTDQASLDTHQSVLAACKKLNKGFLASLSRGLSGVW